MIKAKTKRGEGAKLLFRLFLGLHAHLDCPSDRSLLIFLHLLFITSTSSGCSGLCGTSITHFDILRLL